MHNLQTDLENPKYHIILSPSFALHFVIQLQLPAVLAFHHYFVWLPAVGSPGWEHMKLSHDGSIYNQWHRPLLSIFLKNGYSGVLPCQTRQLLK